MDWLIHHLPAWESWQTKSPLFSPLLPVLLPVPLEGVSKNSVRGPAGQNSETLNIWMGPGYMVPHMMLTVGRLGGSRGRMSTVMPLGSTVLYSLFWCNCSLNQSTRHSRSITILIYSHLTIASSDLIWRWSSPTSSPYYSPYLSSPILYPHFNPPTLLFFYDKTPHPSIQLLLFHSSIWPRVIRRSQRHSGLPSTRPHAHR